MEFNIAWRIAVTGVCLLVVFAAVINMTPKGWPNSAKGYQILAACVLLLGLAVSTLATFGGVIAMIWTY